MMQPTAKKTVSLVACVNYFSEDTVMFIDQ